jgi:hypothetical protein
MFELLFSAPAFFDADAVPDDDLVGQMHDAPGMAEDLARIHRFSKWLCAELRQKGVAACVPGADEGAGWIMSAPASSGFIMISTDYKKKDQKHFQVRIEEMNAPLVELERVLEVAKTILSETAEVQNLSVRKVV